MHKHTGNSIEYEIEYWTVENMIESYEIVKYNLTLYIEYHRLSDCNLHCPLQSQHHHLTMPRKSRIIPVNQDAKASRLFCKLCNHGCNKLWGLTQHMLIKHPSHFDQELVVKGIDSGDKDEPSLNTMTPSSLPITISADNDNTSATPPFYIDIPDKNTAQNQTMFRDGSSHDLYENSEEATRDNDNISETSSTDSDEYLNIDAEVIPQAQLYEDEVLEDHRGGHVYQNHHGKECPAMSIQHNDHRDKGHPYLPWSNANQIWVTNLIYIQARMTMKSTNTLLQGLEDGKARIEGVNFGTAKTMLSLLDNANYVPVHSVCSCYFVLLLVYLMGDLTFPRSEVFQIDN